MAAVVDFYSHIEQTSFTWDAYVVKHFYNTQTNVFIINMDYI